MDIKDKCSVPGDQAWKTTFAISHIPWNDQGTLLAQGHLWNARVPPWDNPAGSDLGLEVSSTNRTVKLVALVLVVGLFGIVQPASVFDDDFIARLWVVDVVARGEEFLLELRGHDSGSSGGGAIWKERRAIAATIGQGAWEERVKGE